MTNMLQWGSAWLSSQLQKSASETIIYRRSTDAVEVNATYASTEYEGTDQYGLTVRMTARDFLIPAAELMFAGSLATPVAGDTIEVILGDQSQTWEVMPIAADGQCFSLDPQGVTYRIHTRQIEVA